MRIELTDEIKERLATAESAVAFSGAGVSRESGLATFRGDGGLWESFRPEELATPEAFRRRPGVVWRWYASRYRTAVAASPNPAHLVLTRFEAVFPSMSVVTQNVDGLHRRAGSSRLLELHGTILEARCERCGVRRDMGEAIAESAEEPPVHACGGRFRPAVVWFGEQLPEGAMEQAAEETAGCDLFLSVGTSAVVYPAAGLIEVAHRAGALLVEVNPEPTPFSGLMDLCLRAPAGEALPALLEEIERCRRPT